MLTTLTPWAGIEPAAVCFEVVIHLCGRIEMVFCWRWCNNIYQVHLRVAFDRPNLGSIPSDISTELRFVIDSMLAREPEQRPQAAELLKKTPFAKKPEWFGKIVLFLLFTCIFKINISMTLYFILIVKFYHAYLSNLINIIIWKYWWYP